MSQTLSLCFDRLVDEKRDEKTDKVALGLATGWILIRHRPYRRNLLFITTIVTLILVFAGAIPLGAYLMERPLSFTLYWLGCFSLVGFVFILAVYDLIRIRSDHRHRMIELEKELADAAEEAREIAAGEQAGEEDRIEG